MRWTPLLAALALGLAAPAHADTYTRSQLNAWADAAVFPNHIGAVQPAALNALLKGIIGNLASAPAAGVLLNTAAMAAAKASDFPEGVWRLDAAAGAGAPPLLFAPQTGTCADHGLVNDGGACVDDAVGGSFAARLPPLADLREWGVALQASGTVDYSAAINAALAWSAAAESAVYWPGGGYAYASNPIYLPPGGMIRGAQSPSNGPVGAELRCAASSAACLYRGASGAQTGTKIEGLYIHSTASPGAGMRNLDAFDIADRDIKVQGFGDCLYFKNDNVTGGGLGYRISGVDTGACSHAHVVFDGWAEAKITQGRFGMNGPGDVTGTDSFFLITGGFTGTAGGPNTIHCDLCQFNTGGSNTSPVYLMHYASIPSGVDTGAMIISNSTLDANSGGMSAIVRVDSTVLSPVMQLNLHDNVFNAPGVIPVDYQTTVSDVSWNWHDNKFALNGAGVWDWPSVQHVDLQFHNNYINMGSGCGDITVYAAAGSVGNFDGNNYDGSCQWVISGTWRSFSMVGGSKVPSLAGGNATELFRVDENTATGETLSSASAVEGGNYQLSYLTGTTTITTFGPTWPGRVHYFLPLSGLSFAAGGSGDEKICNNFTAASNQLVVGLYDRNNRCWYLH